MSDAQDFDRDVDLSRFASPSAWVFNSGGRLFDGPIRICDPDDATLDLAPKKARKPRTDARRRWLDWTIVFHDTRGIQTGLPMLTRLSADKNLQALQTCVQTDFSL